ncbi:hypothetical protein CWU_00540 [Buchnera aphidicola str. JF98 (Acyrthosiphon pisum)]|nr:hypothetical protein CWU_00540 [Buchnera aphidicola str. JF98 (Acyrthosiphon pisum)]
MSGKPEKKSEEEYFEILIAMSNIFLMFLILKSLDETLPLENLLYTVINNPPSLLNSTFSTILFLTLTLIPIVFFINTSTEALIFFR